MVEHQGGQDTVEFGVGVGADHFGRGLGSDGFDGEIAGAATNFDDAVAGLEVGLCDQAVVQGGGAQDSGEEVEGGQQDVVSGGGEVIVRLTRVVRHQRGMPVHDYRSDPVTPPVSTMRYSGSEPARRRHIHNFPALWYVPTTGSVHVAAAGQVVDGSMIESVRTGVVCSSIRPRWVVLTVPAAYCPTPTCRSPKSPAAQAFPIRDTSVASSAAPSDWHPGVGVRPHRPELVSTDTAHSRIAPTTRCRGWLW